MRRILNTIYVTSEGAWLRKDGANLVVEVDGAECGRAPLHLLDGVGQLWPGGCLAGTAGRLRRSGRDVSHLDPNGRFLARVEGPRSGNVLLRGPSFASPTTPRARPSSYGASSPPKPPISAPSCAARCATTGKRCRRRLATRWSWPSAG